MPTLQMKDKRIKELLIQLTDYDSNVRLDNNESKELIDYITNLQEENKEWSLIFDTFSKRPYANKYLKEKKKELGNDKIIGLDSEMVYKEYYDYKSRIEKAIEYITSEETINMFSSINAREKWLKINHKLLNILQGVGKDEKEKE